jgi:hypothetical protein
MNTYRLLAHTAVRPEPGIPFGTGAEAPGVAPAEDVVVRPVQSPQLLEKLSADRRAVYSALGVDLHDGALDAQRRFGTTVGLFIDQRLVGAFSAWRLSEALLSLGYLLGAVGIQRYDPHKVVELASMFVLPEFSGKGYVRKLFEAGRILIAGMQPDLIVAFAVRSVADRYIHRYGFRPVGNFTPHPLAPTVEVIPLVTTYPEFARVHFA